MVARVRCVRAVGSRSTMSELFEAWFATAVDGWSPSTVRQNRSVLDCHLHRHIGSVVVGDVTPALIDALYVRLRRGDNDDPPVGGSNGGQNPRRDELGVLTGDAMGVGLGQSGVTSTSDRRSHERDAPTDTG